MKKVVLLLVLAAISTIGFAQVDIGYRPYAIHGSHGVSFDTYGRQMSLDWMKSRTSYVQPFRKNLESYQEDIITITPGYNMSLQLILVDPESKAKPEIRIGASTTIAKEALIDYTTEDRSYMYCFLENELGVSGEALWKASAYRFSLYAGVGFNAAASINNSLVIFDSYFYNGRPRGSRMEATPSSNIEEWAGKNVFYTRVYTPLGLSVKIGDRWELTGEQRLGVGAASVGDGSQTNLLFHGQTNFGVRFNFVDQEYEKFFYY